MPAEHRTSGQMVRELFPDIEPHGLGFLQLKAALHNGMVWAREHPDASAEDAAEESWAEHPLGATRGQEAKRVRWRDAFRAGHTRARELEAAGEDEYVHVLRDALDGTATGPWQYEFEDGSIVLVGDDDTEIACDLNADDALALSLTREVLEEHLRMRTNLLAEARRIETAFAATPRGSAERAHLHEQMEMLVRIAGIDQR